MKSVVIKPPFTKTIWFYILLSMGALGIFIAFMYLTSIKKLNTSNEEMSRKISLLSAGMEQRINQIDCLEKCIKKYSDRCLENCTGKTKWSTPPPPLIF